MSTPVKHVGFKTLALIIGWLLAAVWTILQFIFVWITAEVFTMQILQNWLIGLIACVIILPIFAFIGHVLWKFAHKVEDLIG